LPTVHRENGFRVSIRTNDHPPPHVHVDYAGSTVMIYLGNDSVAPSIHLPHGMGTLHARYALRLVERHQREFLAAWERYHGT
jgi:hypothetical protein